MSNAAWRRTGRSTGPGEKEAVCMIEIVANESFTEQNPAKTL